MRHYILTRFNLGLYRRNKYLRPVQTEAWLRQRFELFERYCLPSVAAQTGGEFVWLLLFDSETPEVYRQRVREYVQRYPFIRPILVRSEDSWHFVHICRRIIRKDLLELKAQGTTIERVITTCLDNDDALATDFLARVTDASHLLPNQTFITLPYGLQYFTELNMATRIHYPQNHFLSLVETPTQDALVRTVYAYGDHSRLFQYKGVHIHELSTPIAPAWVEVVHTNNVANDVYMRWDTPLEQNLNILRERFAINQTLSLESSRIYYTRFALRRLREVFRKCFVKFLGVLPESLFSNRYQPRSASDRP